MQKSAEQRLAALRERGLGGPEDVEQLSVFRKMSLARDMKKVRERTERRLGQVLTHAQMDDFKEMQDALQRERRAASRRRESS
jgi:hypothetical protein